MCIIDGIDREYYIFVTMRYLPKTEDFRRFDQEFRVPKLRKTCGGVENLRPTKEGMVVVVEIEDGGPT